MSNRKFIFDHLIRTIEAPDANGGGETPQEEAPDTDAQEGDGEEEGSGEDFDAKALLEKVRKTNQENRALRQRAKDAEAKAEGVDEKDQRITALEAEKLRLSVALQHGIPAKLAARLNGTTEEELLKDAQELMELFEGRKPPTQQPREKRGFEFGQTGQEGDETDLERIGARMFGN